MQHGQIALSLLLVPGRYPTKLLQPIDQPLHQVATAVKFSINGSCAPLIALVRNGVSVTSHSQILAGLGETVPFVADEALRADTRPTTPTDYSSVVQ